MTTYVIVGHGGFSPTSGGYPPEVLLPPGVTFKFYSEAGQALVLPAENGSFTYDTEVAPAWKQLKERTEASPSQGVVYNLELGPLDTQEERNAALKADWDGALVWKVEKDLWLCQGTADTCPTPELNVRARTETIPDDRWLHHCDGFLGQAEKGEEYHWVSCTSYMVERHDLPPLVTAHEAGPGREIAPDWIPDDDAVKEIIALNKTNIKAVDNGGEAGVAVGGALVIIGSGHSAEAASYIKRQRDMEEGILTVKKGGAFSKGSMTVKGFTPAKQDLIRKSIEEFSDKKVTFA